jgi:lactate permease
VQRTPPVVKADAKPEAARFTINWLSAPDRRVRGRAAVGLVLG